MKKSSLMILVLLFMAGATLNAQAMMGTKDKGDMGPKDLGMMGMGNSMHEEMLSFQAVKTLDLNDKQLEDITAIHYKYAKVLVAKRAEVQVSEIELKEILEKEPVDMKAAEDKIKQTENTRSDIQIQLLRLNEEIKAILTPEQKKVLKNKLEMMPMKGEMMGDKSCPMMKGMDHSTPAKNKTTSNPAPATHQHDN